jgi:hypothetical protein
MTDINSLIRKLAKESDNQNLYILARDIGSIEIFKNNRDFTYIQNLFLKYLSFYYTLYSDIAIGEIAEIVLESDIYEDSYIMYKNKMDKEKFKKKPDIDTSKGNEINKGTSTWIFK